MSQITNPTTASAERPASAGRTALLPPRDRARAPFRADPVGVAGPGRVPRRPMVAWLNATYPRQLPTWSQRAAEPWS